MPRKKKEGHFLNCYVDNVIWKSLDIYSKDTGIPKTTVIEKALKVYLRAHTNRDVVKMLEDK